MCGWRLIFAIWAGCRFHASDSSEGAARALLAPLGSQTATEVQGHRQEALRQHSGEEGEAEGANRDFQAVGAPFISATSSPPSDLEADQNDVALPAMPDEQFGKERVLRFVQRALVNSLAQGQETIQEQKHEGQHSLQGCRVEGGFAECGAGMECFSKQCPVDTFHAYRKNGQQEGRDDRWSWCQGSSGTDGSAARSGFGGRRSPDPRRAEDSSASQRPTRNEDAAAGRHAGAAGTIHGKGPGGTSNETIDAWTFEQAQQAEGTSIFIRKEDRSVGRRVGEVQKRNTGEDQDACPALPAVPFGAHGGLQWQVGGAAEPQAGDECRLHDYAGCLMDSTNRRGEPSGGLCAEPPRSHRLGGVSGCSGFDRRYGRGGHGGGDSGRRGWESLQARQDLPGINLTIEGGKPTPQSQSPTPRSEGCQGQGDKRVNKDLDSPGPGLITLRDDIPTSFSSAAFWAQFWSAKMTQWFEGPFPWTTLQGPNLRDSSYENVSNSATCTRVVHDEGQGVATGPSNGGKDKWKFEPQQFAAGAFNLIQAGKHTEVNMDLRAVWQQNSNGCLRSRKEGNVDLLGLPAEAEIKQEANQWRPHHDWVPRPLATGEKFFLNLFSGHRRDENPTSRLHWDGRVVPISVDFGGDGEAGDALQLDLWVRLIAASKVIGAHAGPPCETHTAARWNEIAGKPYEGCRPDMGQAVLPLREVQQCTYDGGL